MSIISVIEKIEVVLGIDKIINSCRKWSKDKKKRQDLEQIRHYNNLADDLKRENMHESAEICGDRVKNIKETMNKDEL